MLLFLEITNRYAYVVLNNEIHQSQVISQFACTCLSYCVSRSPSASLFQGDSLCALRYLSRSFSVFRVAAVSAVLSSLDSQKRQDKPCNSPSPTHPKGSQNQRDKNQFGTFHGTVTTLYTLHEYTNTAATRTSKTRRVAENERGVREGQGGSERDT